MNIWDILILIGVFGILLFALRVLQRSRKSGGCSACGSNCGCSCEKCRSFKRDS